MESVSSVVRSHGAAHHPIRMKLCLKRNRDAGVEVTEEARGARESKAGGAARPTETPPAPDGGILVTFLPGADDRAPEGDAGAEAAEADMLSAAAADLLPRVE